MRATPSTPPLKQMFFFVRSILGMFFSVFDYFAAIFLLMFKQLCSLALLCTAKITETSYLQCLPPSVVMSQNTFKELPFFSGSIQYSPSFWKKPESRMSLQEWPGWLKYKPLVAEKEMSFNLNGFIDLHTPVKMLWIGEKATRKLKHDCPHLSSEMRFKKSPQLKIYTILIALNNHVFCLATCKVELL